MIELIEIRDLRKAVSRADVFVGLPAYEEAQGPVEEVAEEVSREPAESCWDRLASASGLNGCDVRPEKGARVVRYSLGKDLT